MCKKYYANREDFENNKPNMIIEHIKGKFCDTEIEVKIIEPVYEYQVVFKPNNNDFYITAGYFSNEQEFLNDRWNKWEFIELYLPSKRERKK